MVDTAVFAAKPKNPLGNIVYSPSSNYQLFEVDYDDSEDFLWMLKKIISLGPDVVYFCGGKLWLRNDAQIVSELKQNLPQTKFVWDIKSPPLIKNASGVRRLRQESSSFQHLLDKVFSRSLEDVEDWIADPRADVVIYPLGVSIKSFSPKKYHDKQTIYCRKFVYIGALHPRREIDKLLLYVAELPPRLRSLFHLDMFGSGPYFENAKAIIQKDHLEDIITLNGSLEQNRLFELLPSYDAGIGWVPYNAYDYAPSLKALEYIASGLVPFVSDTIAHQRLFESGFDVAFFSNEKNSFIRNLSKLCLEGFPVCKTESNLELIHRHDWDNVVDVFLFPAIKDLNKKKSHNRLSDDRGLKKENRSASRHTQENKECLPLKCLRIFMMYESESMINADARELVIGLEKRGHMVGVGYPPNLKGGTRISSDRIHAFLWDQNNVGINDYTEEVLQFSPQLIVIFYQSYNVLDYIQKFFKASIPIIVSERAMPERVLASNWAKLLHIGIGEASWQREIMLSMATSIHLSHRSYIFSVPKHLHPRVYVFDDTMYRCILDRVSKPHYHLLNGWELMILQTMESVGGQKTITAMADTVSYERSLHLRRMRKRLAHQDD